MKVVKFLTLLAAIAILVFLYLMLQEKHLPKRFRQTHFPQFYSINTTVIPHLPIEAKVTIYKKDVTKLLAELHGNHLEQAVRFQGEQIASRDTLVRKTDFISIPYKTPL